MTGLVVVITTIQMPTLAVASLAQVCGLIQASVIVVGDHHGPESYELPGTVFLSLSEQISSQFELARMAPVGHYTRKNIGYLEAFRRGAGCVYETDDDNSPLKTWAPRNESVDVREDTQSGWVNVYRWFTGRRIWPRGFPLDLLHDCLVQVPETHVTRNVNAPIQQGLANGSPDVDAIWRLVFDTAFEFDAGPSVLLLPGAWCPFNSQSTWWWPSAYPLMYLPSHCSFRMTDIWRSFIAQRCLWELGHGVVFHAPEVMQERNEHDLMHDFADEVVGYIRNKEFVGVLEGLALKSGEGQQGKNLRQCYETLVARKFFPEAELPLVDAWLTDLESLGCASASR